MKKILLALSISAVMAGAAQANEWNYSAEHGPAHWGEFSQTCAAGKNQSPINISGEVKADLQELNVNYAGKVTALVNNGHTLQAVVEGDNTVTIDGDTFTLQQFHFHTPSENLIEDKQFPLEAHFVNADADGNLTVVAVMFDNGVENEFLTSLTQTMPKVGETVTLPKPLEIKDFLPQTDEYYRFNGSLTTPPCSEGVRWFVLKDVSKLAASQAEAMMKVMGHNNRPVQNLNARSVMTNN
ncbi:carbonic anhydrase [Vibrio xiamenensis]|uniref:Carbonic anhydrase n=1 Tax=Vibrio xiamenensis TaxID=861298 RepID=A0A1G8A4M8_9VIBR|nr:carbonic anhydrase family protein [Vibrio xiamenensis]SDH15833.1 carbonic anhydrase [Vibrio xiamenensis]